MSIFRFLLRTKTTGEVVSSDLQKREIIVGNTERCIFVKDYTGNMNKYVRADDTVNTENNTWTAKQIKDRIDAVDPFAPINSQFELDIDGNIQPKE